jgi:hypothetical protein
LAAACCTGITGAGVELVVMGGVSWAIGDSLVELAGLGLSLEHPTATEQAIRSAAKISVLVLSRFFWKFFLPQATELKVDGAVRNRLIRVMVGHLLLLSSDWGECME